MTTPPEDTPIKLAFVDTETTGLDLDQHEIWEVGLIVEDQAGTESAEYVWQLPVEHLERADKHGLDIGRWHQRRWPRPTALNNHRAAVVGDWTEENAGLSRCRLTDGDMPGWAERFCELTWDAVLVGIVPSFDDWRLQKLVRRHHQVPGWYYQPLCAETLAAGWLAGWATGSDGPTSTEAMAIARAVPWDTAEISRLLDVTPPADGEDRHTALGDARWARDLWRAVFAPPVVDRSQPGEPPPPGVGLPFTGPI
jgi:hypothetical protein